MLADLLVPLRGAAQLEVSLARSGRLGWLLEEAKAEAGGIVRAVEDPPQSTTGEKAPETAGEAGHLHQGPAGRTAHQGARERGLGRLLAGPAERLVVRATRMLDVGDDAPRHASHSGDRPLRMPAFGEQPLDMRLSVAIDHGLACPMAGEGRRARRGTAC